MTSAADRARLSLLMASAVLAVACVAGCQKSAPVTDAPQASAPATVQAQEEAARAADKAQEAAARAADAAVEGYTIDAPGDAARSGSAGAAWYEASVDATGCFKSDAPADRIQELRDAGDHVTTRDRLDASGQLVAVEVAVDEPNGLQQRFWTYYRSQGACEAKVAADHAIPDKYR